MFPSYWGNFVIRSNRTRMTITDYTNEAIDLLKHLIATPSISRDEKRAADVMQQCMESYGLTTHRIKNNVWTIGPDYDSHRPTILLNAHIDTVKAVSSWTRPLPAVGRGRKTLRTGLQRLWWRPLLAAPGLPFSDIEGSEL